MARNTHDLGHLYFHGMKVPTGGPLVERGTSHEVEQPWRVGRCVVLRAWRYALVVGWWGPGRTVEDVKAAERDPAYDVVTGYGIVTPPDNAKLYPAAFRPEPLTVTSVMDDWKVEKCDLLPGEYRVR